MMHCIICIVFLVISKWLIMVLYGAVGETTQWYWTLFICENVLFRTGTDAISRDNARKSFDFDARVGALAPWRAEDAVVVQLIDGRLFCLRLASLELAERGAWAEFCPQLDLIDDRVVGLAASGRLYCDGRQLLDAISSFVVRGDFLMATSVQNHQLVCMAAESLLASDPPAASQRRIERGADDWLAWNWKKRRPSVSRGQCRPSWAGRWKKKTIKDVNFIEISSWCFALNRIYWISNECG